MNIKEAKQEIINTVQAYLRKNSFGEYEMPAVRQRPILLMGPPGIGKTQIMEQVAKECKIGLVSYTITHHTRQSAVGLPFIKEKEFGGKIYSVTEYTMSEIIASVYQEMEESGKTEGILFIDEINCVSETLAPTMLQFLQAKTFGNQKVPAGWIIVAAGNPPEYNKSVREFDMVTLDRVRRMDIEADHQVWREYAREAGIHNAILSYLEIHPKHFYKVEFDVDGLQFVTARGWEDFSHLLCSYKELKIPVTEEVVFEYLRHRDIAEEVAAYLELYEKYEEDYQIDKILSGEASPVIYERLLRAGFDERVTVVELILESLSGVIEKYFFEKKITDRWYQFLKEYRAGVEEAEDGYAYYLSLVEREKERALSEKNAGLYTEDEERMEKILLFLWTNSAPAMADGGAEEHFAEAKKGFEQKKKEMEQKKEQAKSAMANAFSFIEQAFEGGQEMVLFVTELTVTAESVQFLSEVPNEKYLKYSEELMIGTRRQELLTEMEREEG